MGLPWPPHALPGNVTEAVPTRRKTTQAGKAQTKQNMRKACKQALKRIGTPTPFFFIDRPEEYTHPKNTSGLPHHQGCKCLYFSWLLRHWHYDAKGLEVFKDLTSKPFANKNTPFCNSWCQFASKIFNVDWFVCRFVIKTYSH